MTSPAWLIAEREFRTYVGTSGFWVTLAIGPLAACALLVLPTAHAPAFAIAVRGEASLARAVTHSVEEAARIEGKHLRFAPDGDAQLMVHRPAPGRVVLEFSDQFPLSASGRALVARTLERDAAREATGEMALSVHANGPAAAHGPDADALARLASMMMLWLTLTGSMGMLLQTVVRERSSRALESLLAAAAPRAVVAGKIAGIGAVSLLVLGAWLGSAAALSLLMPEDAGLARAIVTSLADPALLARDAVIYLFAYVFYGAVTVLLGSLARDSASAQNLARPMFVLLLAGFFLALSCVSAGLKMTAFVYLPPFTPFLLLIYPAGALAPGLQAALLAVLGFAAWAVLALAGRVLSVSPDFGNIFRHVVRDIQSLVRTSNCRITERASPN